MTEEGVALTNANATPHPPHSDDQKKPIDPPAVMTAVATSAMALDIVGPSSTHRHGIFSVVVAVATNQICPLEGVESFAFISKSDRTIDSMIRE